MFFKWLSFSEKKNFFCFLLRLCPIVKSSFNVALLWEFFDIFKFWLCFAAIYILGLNKGKYFICCLKSSTFRKILHSPHYYALENNSTLLTKHLNIGCVIQKYPHLLSFLAIANQIIL